MSHTSLTNWVLSTDLRDYFKQFTVLTVKALNLKNRNVDTAKILL